MCAIAIISQNRDSAFIFITCVIYLTKTCMCDQFRDKMDMFIVTILGMMSRKRRKGTTGWCHIDNKELDKGIRGRKHNRWQMIGPHGVKEVVQLKWLTSEPTTK